MDNKHIALKLALDAVGIDAGAPQDFSWKRTKASVYFLQENGLPLGYHFKWIMGGIYESTLLEDVEELQSHLLVGDTAADSIALRPGYEEAIAKTCAVLAMPESLQIDPLNWLSTVPALHFLTHKSRLDLEEAKAAYLQVRPSQAPIIEPAVEHLMRLGMLPAALAAEPLSM